MLSMALLNLDQHWDMGAQFDFKILDPTQPASAQSLLSTIAGSVIGVAGVVFSITMVSVSFASGNFGPRLIGNFMRDRGNQISLGIFIGTFIYTLIILRAVKGGDAQSFDATSIEEFVPQFSIAVSLGLAVVCMGTLIYFIHHVPEMINIERIISQLGRSMKSGIRHRFPTGVLRDMSFHAECETWHEDECGGKRYDIEFSQEGYLQEIDLKSLHQISEQNDLLIKVHQRPGVFVNKMTCMMSVWVNNELSDGIYEELANCVTTDANKTIVQDVEFVVDQLIEVIARALSPGMNDPFTAIACMNWLQVGILQFAHDQDLNADRKSYRVKVESLLFEDFVDKIFIKSLPYISSDINVALRSIEILDFLMEKVPNEDQRLLLEKHRDRLDESAKKSS